MLLVVDFDQTLVKENSSRLLEKVLIEESFGLKKFLGRVFFLSNFAKVFNLVLSVLSRIFFQRRDLRLYTITFLYVNPEKLMDHISRVVELFSINENVMSEVRKAERVLILSLGYESVIQKFLINKYKGYTKVIASELIVSRDQGISVKIKNYNDKISELRSIDSFRYLTDSKEEVEIIERKFNNVSSGVFVNSEEKIYWVKK